MKEITELMQKQLYKMETLYRSSMNTRELWKVYLGSFKDGENPIFRAPDSTIHNCNYCNNFICRYGNIVGIDKNNKIITLFDGKVEGKYKSVFKAMSKALKQKPIDNLFFESHNKLVEMQYHPKLGIDSSTRRLGVDKNVKRYTKEEAELYDVVKPNQLITFEHFHLDVPMKYVIAGSVATRLANYGDTFDVMSRGLDEISLDTLELVKELFLQKSLFDGEPYYNSLDNMIKLKKEYESLGGTILQHANWIWKQVEQRPMFRFRNTLIGVLCVDLSQGMDLTEACNRWNKAIDSENWQKAKVPYTAKQKEDALKFAKDNGYLKSLERRLATKSDVRAQDTIYVKRGGADIKEVTVFDSLKESTKPTRHSKAKLDGIGTVTIETFLDSILPGCSSVDVLLENRLENHFVTMTAPVHGDAKNMFLWDNPFSWTYRNNLAGKTNITKAVKDSGGKIDGFARFSIMWGEGDPSDNSDLDAHCKLPSRETIYFGRYALPKKSPYGGYLDLDITHPNKQGNKNIVENIVFPDNKLMTDGEYVFMVNQYANRGNKGFQAELLLDGTLYSYEFDAPLNGTKLVATVTMKGGVPSIKHHMREISHDKEIYGLKANNFHRADLICLSPNYWGKNKVGKKHYFFMLKGAKVEIDVRGYHVENLNTELKKHRKVFEPLADKVMIPKDGPQLSGIGFSTSSKDDYVILKLKGSFERLVKVTF